MTDSWKSKTFTTFGGSEHPAFVEPATPAGSLEELLGYLLRRTTKLETPASNAPTRSFHSASLKNRP